MIAGILPEIGAEQKAVARTHGARDVAQKQLRAPARSKLPIVLPRNAKSAGCGSAGRGRAARRCRPTTGSTPNVGILRAQPLAASSRNSALTSIGTYTLAAPASTHRVEQQARLVRAAGAELDERARPQRAIMTARSSSRAARVRLA